MLKNIVFILAFVLFIVSSNSSLADDTVFVLQLLKVLDNCCSLGEQGADCMIPMSMILVTKDGIFQDYQAREIIADACFNVCNKCQNGERAWYEHRKEIMKKKHGL